MASEPKPPNTPPSRIRVLMALLRGTNGFFISPDHKAGDVANEGLVRDPRTEP